MQYKDVVDQIQFDGNVERLRESDPRITDEVIQSLQDGIIRRLSAARDTAVSWESVRSTGAIPESHIHDFANNLGITNPKVLKLLRNFSWSYANRILDLHKDPNYPSSD